MILSILRNSILTATAITSLAMAGPAQAQTIELVNTGQDLVYSTISSGLLTGVGVAGDPLGDLVPLVNDLALTGADPLSSILPPLLDGDILGSSGLSLAPLVSDLTGTLTGAVNVPQLTDTLAITNNILLPILGGR